MSVACYFEALWLTTDDSGICAICLWKRIRLFGDFQNARTMYRLCCLGDTVYAYMMLFCGHHTILALLVYLTHVIISILQLSLVLDDVTLSRRFYFGFVCQVLILFCTCARLFSCVLGWTVWIVPVLMSGNSFLLSFIFDFSISLVFFYVSSS